MEKSKVFRNCKFSSRLLRQAVDKCSTNAKSAEMRISHSDVTKHDEKWSFDNLEEFLAAYANEDISSAELCIWWDVTDVSLRLFLFNEVSHISVKGTQRSQIEAAFSTFEDASSDDKIVIAGTPRKHVTIFIGHGRSNQWIKLKNHLQDKHEIDIESYESGARAGHTIRDILDRIADDSSMALLVLTGEDRTAKGRMRARQNVIHECGLFQGRVGFDRAILLVEAGVELGSNFDGIQQIRFEKGRISEAFGDVIATIRREFGPI